MIYILIFFHHTYYTYGEQIELLIKIPTRSRPEQFFNRLDIYFKKLSGEVNCTFLISCDRNDLTMNNINVIKRLCKYKNLFFYFGDNKSKVEAYNADINKHLNFNVLLVASDDMEPVVDGYDKIIMDRMKRAFPDYDGVLNFNDGYVGSDLNTMPVIGKKYYDLFGYVYFPDYKSFACDNELTLVSEMLKKQKICNETIIIHRHPVWGNGISDELYKYNDQFWFYDKQLFEKRKSENFSIILIK